MHLKTLSLKNFRNYTFEKFFFEEGIHGFLGDNAQGKTSLLEAINLLSTGRSFRSHKLKELIQYGKPHFLLEAVFHKEGVSHHFKFFYDGTEKRLEYNDQHYLNFYPLLGLMPMVLLCPEDINLISGGPGYRRRFFDLLAAQSDPNYLLHLTRYHKAMRQRNALLKSKNSQAIFPWEAIMIASAKILITTRMEILEKITHFTEKWLSALSHGVDQIELRYQMHTSLKKNLNDYEKTLSSLFDEMREKEMILGQTLVGPHRDDIEILIQGKLADAFASEGQKRSILIALKFAEWQVLQEKLKTAPILAFDDFGMHLDDKRKAWTAEALQQFGQVFITSPSPIHTPLSPRYYWIEQGQIKIPNPDEPSLSLQKTSATF